MKTPHGEGDEFWYCTLAEALNAAADLGVPTDAWTEISSVDDVGTSP
jgi:hypothetical protein